MPTGAGEATAIGSAVRGPQSARQTVREALQGLRGRRQYYDLQEDLQHYRTMFAVLYKRPREVRLFFYPLNVWPDLRELLPASLQSQITGKWIIKVAILGAAEKKALAAMLAEAWRRIAAIARSTRRIPSTRSSISKTRTC